MRPSTTKTKYGRINVILRQDLTGLGVQTRAIARLLEPEQITVIDFSSINGNKQYPHLIENLSGDKYVINGFIQPKYFDKVLENTDILISCEIDYSAGYSLTEYAQSKGIKVIIVANYEFADWLQNPNLPVPDVVANHSLWNNKHLESHLKREVPVLPTPIDMGRYDEIYEENLKRSHRFLHVAGRKTHEDRNGTKDLLKAIKLIPEEIDFELVIKTQTAEVECDDPRVSIDTSEPEDERNLYRGFDAMILPRRYGGGCLPRDEALASGLPVIMTDIDPNNKTLPRYWLCDADKVTSFMARTNIDVYSADPTGLAGRIAQFAAMSDTFMKGNKEIARNIAWGNLSEEVVGEKWDLLLQNLEV